jgi:hypothetical protein
VLCLVFSKALYYSLSNTGNQQLKTIFREWLSSIKH